jgi:hypothetical protein
MNISASIPSILLARKTVFIAIEPMGIACGPAVGDEEALRLGMA